MKIGGKPRSYIKVKDIEQTADGHDFAIPYIDNGIFKIRVTTRCQVEKAEKNNNGHLECSGCHDFEFNSVLGIDNYTEPNK
jgi:hypothetical protein